MSDSPLFDLLTRFPKCRVTIASSRPRPREGDRKLIKSRGGWHVRTQRITDGMGHVRNGRPVYDWVKETP